MVKAWSWWNLEAEAWEEHHPTLVGGRSLRGANVSEILRPLLSDTNLFCNVRAVALHFHYIWSNFITKHILHWALCVVFHCIVSTACQYIRTFNRKCPSLTDLHLLCNTRFLHSAVSSTTFIDDHLLCNKFCCIPSNYIHLLRPLPSSQLVVSAGYILLDSSLHLVLHSCLHQQSTLYTHWMWCH